MSYADFALFYDRLTENIDYEALAEMYAGLLYRYGARGGELLDLACGTGSLAVLLAERGFDVTAADISQEMLTVAAAKSSEVHKRSKLHTRSKLRWLCLDMTRLSFEERFDAVVCALDSINHLPDLSAVQQTFDGVYRSLKAGGVFAADLNTPYKHREVLGNNAYTFDYEGLYCGWQNELDESDSGQPCRVDMFLDFFEENEDGSYTRYSDSLSEIAPEPELIVEMLEKSGFSEIEVSEYPTGGKLTDTDEKFTVIAKK